MGLPIGLQLFTVRDETVKDAVGTLTKLAEMGYQIIELAGLAGMSASEYKKVCNDLGLTVSSGHHGYAVLENQLNEAFDEADQMDYKILICPSLPGEMQNPDGYKRAADVLAAAHQKAQQRGLTVCYHNHSFEWAELDDGSRGIDLLFANPGLQSQLDIYWVQHGNDDPLEWMNKLSGRVPVLHIKDMTDTADRNFTEVGTGIVDVAGAVALAESIGVQYLIIEQDRHWINDSPLESVKISLDNLKKIVE